MEEIKIVQAGNGLILTGAETKVFELSPGKKTAAVRKLLEAVAKDVGQGCQVEVKVVDPAGESAPNSSIPSPKWFSPKMVAELYGIPEKTLQDWRSKSKGPSYSKPTGGCVIYSKEALDKWYRDHEVLTLED